MVTVADMTNTTKYEDILPASESSDDDKATFGDPFL